MIDRACISICERCDMSCTYCHFSVKGRRGGDISKEDVITIINNIGKYAEENGLDAFKLGIVGGGEPTLRFDVLKSAVIAAESYPEIRMYTISNGLHLTDEMLMFFAEHRDRIKLCISLDGPKGLHDAHRKDARGEGTFDRVRSSVGRYRMFAGSMPAVNCTVHRDNLAQYEELIGFFESEDITDVTFSQIFDDPDLEIDEGDYRGFLELAGTRLDIRQSRDSTGVDCRKYGKRCGAGITNVYFCPQGVYPCGRFAGLEKYRLGSCTDDMAGLEQALSAVKNDMNGCTFDALAAAGEIQ